MCRKPSSVLKGDQWVRPIRVTESFVVPLLIASPVNDNEACQTLPISLEVTPTP